MVEYQSAPSAVSTRGAAKATSAASTLNLTMSELLSVSTANKTTIALSISGKSLIAIQKPIYVLRTALTRSWRREKIAQMMP